MDSYQPFSPSFKSSLMATGVKPAPPAAAAPDGFVGFLDVFIHEARDIHNICIYHKQDVYAKLYLTTDRESAASTQIINGGGRNPVFNQTLRFRVRTLEDGSSLKCEVWMLSRVRNYLEDQLLGLALVPLSDVLMADGAKLEGEFSLSSTDLFHSPAGFVKLSIAYSGPSPDVLAVAAPPPKPSIDEPAGREYDKVEFPDLNVVDENKMMVSEYFGIQCADPDAQNAEGLLAPEEEDCPDKEEAGVRVVESFATVTSPPDTVKDLKKDTPVSSTSETGSSPPPKDKSKEEETDSSSVATTDNAFPAPIININIEPENSVVQQDIVDMYMKSMQQFTDSLAKMKLPMDIENNSGSSNALPTSSSSSNVSTANGDSGADQQPQKTASRVFYGSRAFF
ncbi:uncharacterized protein M6B38_145760 [Iris pallida]|uniref:C2 domain-containing protein n=1 Tax=Iris pallida TaxID=29817 RepID=A0AAX6F8U6_IRIPA|nr:uncharacterized protein M6B38_145760 [Iris pallida]